jgi:hypothetical protein
MPARRDRKAPFYPIVAVALCACSIGGQYGQRVCTEANTEQSNEQIACEIKGPGSPQSIGDFLPWPPPKGSDEQDFTDQILSAIRTTNKSQLRLGDVDEFLRDRIAPAEGRTALTYFVTPDHTGYAAVTRVEAIDERGRRLEGPSGVANDSFLWRFFKRMVTLPEGRFRVLVFFVTNAPITERFSSDPVTRQLANTWVSKGCFGLPREVASLPVTDQKVILRVYEIASKGSDSHLMSKAEATPLPQHMAALGLKFSGQK